MHSMSKSRSLRNVRRPPYLQNYESNFETTSSEEHLANLSGRRVINDSVDSILHETEDDVQREMAALHKDFEPTTFAANVQHNNEEPRNVRPSTPKSNEVLSRHNQLQQSGASSSQPQDATKTYIYLTPARTGAINDSTGTSTTGDYTAHKQQQQGQQHQHQQQQQPPYEDAWRHHPYQQQWQNPPEHWPQFHQTFKFASEESVNQLSNEIVSLQDTFKKEMRKLRKLYERELSTDFPTQPNALPLSSPEQVNDFETIPDDDYRSIVRYLGSLGGHTLIETANEVLKNAMKDSVSPALTWHGRKLNEIALGKTRFAKALYVAVARNRNYPKPNWSEFADAMVNALRGSKQRHRNSLYRLDNRRGIGGNVGTGDQHEIPDTDTGRQQNSNNQSTRDVTNRRSRQRRVSSSSLDSIACSVTSPRSIS